jgi:hypothetical protein
MLYYDSPEEQGFDKKKAKIFFRYLCASTLRHYRDAKYNPPSEKMSELTERMSQLGEKNINLKSSISDLSSKLHQFQEANEKAATIIRNKQYEQPQQPQDERSRRYEDGLKELMDLEKKLQDRIKRTELFSEKPAERAPAPERKIVKREKAPLEREEIEQIERKIEERLQEKHVKIIDDEARPEAEEEPEKKEIRPVRKKELDTKVEVKVGYDLTPLRNKLSDIKSEIARLKRSRRYSKKDVAELEARQKQVEKKIFLLEHR